MILCKVSFTGISNRSILLPKPDVTQVITTSEYVKLSDDTPNDNISLGGGGGEIIP